MLDNFVLGSPAWEGIECMDPNGFQLHAGLGHRKKNYPSLIFNIQKEEEGGSVLHRLFVGNHFFINLHIQHLLSAL